ncbi:MAG TPA: DUF438 domain-containing protein [bacterium]
MSEFIDNRSHRIRTMKDIIKHLHEGGETEEVKSRLKKLVKETDSTEIAAMEQELINEGMPVEEVQSMCDLHSGVLREILVESVRPEVQPGHPVETFSRENKAIQDQIDTIREILETIQKSDASELPDERNNLLAALGLLEDIDKHYMRKEFLLFARLEKYGITGPSTVMWGKDDEAREFLTNFHAAVSESGNSKSALLDVILKHAEIALRAIKEMIFKEENILLPLSLNTLTETDWAEIYNLTPEYGWCLVEPGADYVPAVEIPGPEKISISEDKALAFDTGALTPSQLTGLLDALPVDLTFVDNDGIVRYFKHGPEPAFQRNRAILGRHVLNCHPPKSGNVVQQILDDFAEGRQDVAEFWIEFRGKFIHIRYFAVRDKDGKFLGTMEMTQDLTRLRKIDGERRLLSYAE